MTTGYTWTTVVLSTVYATRSQITTPVSVAFPARMGGVLRISWLPANSKKRC